MPERRHPGAQLDLDAVEANLCGEQAELRGRLAELSRPPERGSQVAFGKRVGDGTTEAVSRLTEVGVFEMLTEAEHRVARALDKIAEGTYGVCDVCEAPIAPGRLRVAPQSTLCVECAR